MDKITKPTIKELRQAWLGESHDFEAVHESFCPEDRGYRFIRVFERLKDGTFWRVRGVNFNEGVYDRLRNECEFITVTQVVPTRKIVTEYIKVEDLERPW